MRTCSTNDLISSTELFEAASSSYTLNEAESLNDLQEGHSLQGSKSAVKCSQLSAFANILAQVVFPTPRGPQNKNACATCCDLMAFLRVETIASWPTTVLKVDGRYLRAETIKFSISKLSL